MPFARSKGRSSPGIRSTYLREAAAQPCARLLDEVIHALREKQGQRERHQTHHQIARIAEVAFDAVQDHVMTEVERVGKQAKVADPADVQESIDAPSRILDGS